MEMWKLFFSMQTSKNFQVFIRKIVVRCWSSRVGVKIWFHLWQGSSSISAKTNTRDFVLPCVYKSELQHNQMRTCKRQNSLLSFSDKCFLKVGEWFDRPFLCSLSGKRLFITWDMLFQGVYCQMFNIVNQHVYYHITMFLRTLNI